MIRAKTLAALTGMLVTLALWAIPAQAEFQSNTSETKDVSNSGELLLEGGGGTLTCTSTEGEWTILSGGVPATKGDTLLQAIKKFSGCKAKSSELKEIVPASIKECTLRFKQAAGETKAKGSIASECQIVIKVGFLTCTIGEPAEKEATNKELLTNTLANSGNELLLTAEDKGVTLTVKGSCLGIVNTVVGVLKSVWHFLRARLT